MTEAATVVVAGTFTLDPLMDTVRWWLRRTRPGSEVFAVPYGQLLESLHDPAGPLMTNHGVNVVVLRPEDLLRHGDDGDLQHSARADAQAEALPQAAARAAAIGRATWLLAVPPPSPRLESDPHLLRWVEASTKTLLEATAAAGIHQVDLTDALDLYQVETIHDEYGDRKAHLPYTDEYLVAVGTSIARTAESILARPRKLIVLDCDNTLWSGVCGEDGPQGVAITEAHRYLQRFMLRQRASGRLLALCSRNEETDVRAVFARTDMELAWTDIAAHRVGWSGKPAAIEDLARELGFSPDSVIFVDDDPVECGVVRQTLPEVAVVQVPGDSADIPDVLRHEWVFDQFTVTDDDRRRADRYAAERHRQAARTHSADYADFLRQCATEIEITALEAEADSSVLDRAAQLTARTTQFSLTGEVFSPAELRDFLRTGTGWTVAVRDRFGDYGTVALILVEALRPVTLVRVLLMSCRVLNRGVEHEILDHLQRYARASGAEAIALPYRYTDRNTPARLFLSALSAQQPLEPPSGRIHLPIVAPAP